MLSDISMLMVEKLMELAVRVKMLSDEEFEKMLENKDLTKEQREQLKMFREM